MLFFQNGLLAAKIQKKVRNAEKILFNKKSAGKIAPRGVMRREGEEGVSGRRVHQGVAMAFWGGFFLQGICCEGRLQVTDSMMVVRACRVSQRQHRRKCLLTT